MVKIFEYHELIAHNTTNGFVHGQIPSEFALASKGNFPTS
tara:strand:- start:1984 stop:2103 length:120 start_codon:yes stop_codon:yes gene_type:complete